MRTSFLPIIVMLTCVTAAFAGPPRIPGTNEIARYERAEPVFKSKAILRERGDALLSALDGGRQIRKIQIPPETIFDPAPAHIWLSIILTNGSTYRIGLGARGDYIDLPEDFCEVTDAAKKGVAKVMSQLDEDLRREVTNAPKPCVYQVGTVDDGGTLSGIARLFYGDASKWRQIFEVNRSVLKNPDMITGREKLTIPKL